MRPRSFVAETEDTFVGLEAGKTYYVYCTENRKEEAADEAKRQEWAGGSALQRTNSGALGAEAARGVLTSLRSAGSPLPRRSSKSPKPRARIGLARTNSGSLGAAAAQRVLERKREQTTTPLLLHRAQATAAAMIQSQWRAKGGRAAAQAARREKERQQQANGALVLHAGSLGGAMHRLSCTIDEVASFLDTIVHTEGRVPFLHPSSDESQQQLHRVINYAPGWTLRHHSAADMAPKRLHEVLVGALAEGLTIVLDLDPIPESERKGDEDGEPLPLSEIFGDEEVFPQELLTDPKRLFEPEVYGKLIGRPTAHAAAHCEVLGLEVGASPEEVKKAYRKLVRTEHPDKGGDHDKFIAIQTAYTALTGRAVSTAEGDADAAGWKPDPNFRLVLLSRTLAEPPADVAGACRPLWVAPKKDLRVKHQRGPAGLTAGMINQYKNADINNGVVRLGEGQYFPEDHPLMHALKAFCDADDGIPEEGSENVYGRCVDDLHFPLFISRRMQSLPAAVERRRKALRMRLFELSSQETEASALTVVDSNVATGQQLLFEDKARGGAMVEVTLVSVDRTVLPPEQEEERGYTVRLPDGRERNTLRARLWLPVEGLSFAEENLEEVAAALTAVTQDYAKMVQSREDAETANAEEREWLNKARARAEKKQLVKDLDEIKKRERKLQVNRHHSRRITKEEDSDVVKELIRIEKMIKPWNKEKAHAEQQKQKAADEASAAEKVTRHAELSRLGSVETFLAAMTAESKGSSDELCEAAFDGELDKVKALIVEGYDVESKDVYEFTALSEAACGGQDEVCKLLLSLGADPNTFGRTAGQKRSPLGRACINDHLSTMKLLLESGAYAEPAWHSVGNPTKEALKLLQSWPAEKTDEVLKQRDQQLQERAAALGADQGPKLSKQSLFQLAERGDAEQMDQALALVAEAAEDGNKDAPTVASRDLNGRTLLHVASWKGHYDVVELLLTAWKKAAAGSPSQAALRVDIDARFAWNKQEGWTAFSVAAFCGHADVIELLRRNGANPLLGTSIHEDGLALVGGPAQQARQVGWMNKCADGISLAIANEGDGMTEAERQRVETTKMAALENRVSAVGARSGMLLADRRPTNVRASRQWVALTNAKEKEKKKALMLGDRSGRSSAGGLQQPKSAYMQRMERQTREAGSSKFYQLREAATGGSLLPPINARRTTA